MLAIRLSEPYQKMVTFWAKLAESSDKLVVYEHDANRMHCHALCVGYTGSTDTLKNWIKKTLVVTVYPKSDWAFATQYKSAAGDYVPINDDFITYMSKGTIQPKLVKGFTQDAIDTYRSLWVPRPRKGERIQYKITATITDKQRKLQVNDMIQEVYSRLNSQGWNGENLNVKGTSLDREIVKTIIEVFQTENHNVIGRYKIRDYYDAVLSRLRPMQYVDQMVQLIAFKNNTG